MDKAESILIGMGFPETADGPFVRELRAHIRKQVERGMLNRSGGTWAPGSSKLTHDERAREILAVDWEIAHGHSYRVELFDGLRSWRHILPWLGDNVRFAAMKARIWWHRNLKNPYRGV